MAAPTALPAPPKPAHVPSPSRVVPGAPGAPVVPAPDRTPRVRLRHLRHVGAVPARVYGFVALVLVGIIALAAVIAVGAGNARSGLGEVADTSAPRAAAAADLYFALADLDAQVANVLLVGSDETIGNRQLALRQMRERRARITVDIQALSSGGAPTATVGALINGLGRYDAYVAQARLADEQVQDRPAGRPPILALNYFASATTLLHDDLLPAADALGRGAEEKLASDADSDGTHARWAALAVGLVGLALVVCLIIGQVWWARRFHRILVPGLAAVTIAVAALTGTAAVLFTDHASRLRDAQTQAFDPFLSLARARATASDANADESRFVILPDRARAYAESFAAKSAQLERVVPNERVATRLEAFRRDDRTLRAAVAEGRLDVAVGLATKVGRGNLAFDFYDYQTSLAQVANANLADFERRTDSADDALSGWPWVPIAILGVCVVLVLASARPRLREYAQR
ncbi:hypothetical protein ACIRL2_32120 [Embleya sp. NPDC127516]|uniref:hypothetical protein n=1 Tax=Embleya sp. NPDC127516 TaxID=3363990 RepID=UPI003824E6D8